MKMEDPFLRAYGPSELKIAAEFLTNWLPFLTKNLCNSCTQTLSTSISSIDPEFSGGAQKEMIRCDWDSDSDTNSHGSWKNSAMGCSKYVPDALTVAQSMYQTPSVLKEIHCDCNGDSDTNSLGSWKESSMGCSMYVPDAVAVDFWNSIGTWKDKEMGCSDYIPDTLSVGLRNSLGSWKSTAPDYVPDSLNVDSEVGCSDYVGDTLNAGLPDSHGSWKWKDSDVECADYIADTLNAGTRDLFGSWKDNATGCPDYVPEALNFDTPESLGSLKSSAMGCSDYVPEVLSVDSPKSLGSWRDSAVGDSDCVPEGSFVNSQSFSASWADMAEDEFAEDDDIGEEEENEKTLSESPGRLVLKRTATLTSAQREYLRFKMVKRRKDFSCLRRVNGTRMNILDGLELHTGVFSVAEQKRILDFIYALEKKGRKGELRERTFSAPEKWMPGKGRVTIQFGCCYNYAVLKDGSPPGILRNREVDPMPHLFKAMIRRLVAWHVLPPTCVPDSCIVNIYDEGDCIPPHIDHHDFLRPFCTVSFLSECNILFGSTLRIVGPGNFSGDFAIPLILGSVLVLNGNGADVAKHCVPKVPTKRISITFRKMDESKHPDGFVPEPDLQCLEPLPFGRDLLHSPPRVVPVTDWLGLLPSPDNNEDGPKTSPSDFPPPQKHKESRRVDPKRVNTSDSPYQRNIWSFREPPKAVDSSEFSPSHRDRESLRVAPKSVDTSDFCPLQKDRGSFQVAPRIFNFSEFPPLQKVSQSNRVSPKRVDTSEFPLLQKDRESFRIAPKSVDTSEFPLLHKDRDLIKVAPKSVDTSESSLMEKDRDSFRVAPESVNTPEFPPPKRNKQSLRIELDSETGRRFSSRGGSLSEPRHSGSEAQSSGTGTRYPGLESQYSGSDARFSSWNRSKALGGPRMRVSLGT